MTVRAKFVVNRIEDNADYSSQPTTHEDGTVTYERVQAASPLKTVVLLAVYGKDLDPNDENAQYWKYTPAGEIRLSTINEQAASQFEVGKTYYVDFSPSSVEPVNPGEPVINQQ